jgi:hypothetical protein
MNEALVLLAVALLLPLFLLPFAFVGCVLNRGGLAEGAWVVIGPGSFAAIDKVDTIVVFRDGTVSVTKGPFTLSSPISEGDTVQTAVHGETTVSAVACICALTPIDPAAETITRTKEGPIRVFRLSGEEQDFALEEDDSYLQLGGGGWPPTGSIGPP